LLSTVTVTNANDGGAGSLRAAIAQVNGDTQPGIDSINFAIGSGPQTITPLSTLPTLTHSVVIDGTTQPGFAGTPLVVIQGGPTGGANGLEIAGGNSTVKGLVIDGFIYDGILLDTHGGDTIEGNYLGMGATGAQPGQQNGLAGVQITGASNNTIGGSLVADRNIIDSLVIGAVSSSGAATDPTSFDLVEGNFIGTDVTGTKGGWRGVQVFGASNNTIGGTTAAARNLINGVSISGNGKFDLVEGNFIGTDVTGTKALGGGQGVNISGSGGSDTIGGTAPGSGNLISGTFSPNAISISLSFGDLIEGNDIGTDVTGKLPLPNGSGILVHGGSATIGGTTVAAGNIIAFNKGPAVLAFPTGGVAVFGNSIFANGSGLASSGITNSMAKAHAVLTSAVSSNGSVAIAGTLTSTAGSSNRLEFFSNPAGTGQGESDLGFITVIADSTGKAAFTTTFAAAVAPGHVITATATDPTPSTSAFSNGEVVIAGSAPQPMPAHSCLCSLSHGQPSPTAASIAQEPAKATTAPRSLPSAVLPQDFGTRSYLRDLRAARKTKWLIEDVSFITNGAQARALRIAGLLQVFRTALPCRLGLPRGRDTDLRIGHSR
jgi:titin